MDTYTVGNKEVRRRYERVKEWKQQMILPVMCAASVPNM
jgi:hypothetical protein